MIIVSYIDRVVIGVAVFLLYPYSIHRCCLWHFPGRKLTLTGDGRCDSPGYTAKYGTYTVMDSDTEHIVDFELSVSTDTTSSVAREKYGFLKVIPEIM